MKNKYIKSIAAVWAVALAVIVVAVTIPRARSTPQVGLVSTLLAPVGRLPEIDSFAKINDWQAKLKTKGDSDLHVFEVTIQPGGSSGWHSHPGLTFVIIKSGTATAYEGDDPNCTPHLIPAGSAFFDSAGEVFLLRNEGSVPLVNVVVELVPAGVPRRTDELNPGYCPNLN